MKGHVFLTGASGGLGLSVLKGLLKNSWKVTAFVHSDKSVSLLKETFPGSVGSELQIIQGNVTREKDIVNALEKMNKIDALVHFAGGFSGAKSISESTLADFQEMISLNTISAFLLLRNILPLLKKQEAGSIVMIGAKPALYPNGQNAVYAASKAALVNLALSAAEEGRSKNVRVNVIVPAVIDTPDNRKWADEKTKTDKWTSPEDIAKTIVWLISENGNAVTGTVIPLFNKMKTF